MSAAASLIFVACEGFSSNLAGWAECLFVLSIVGSKKIFGIVAEEGKKRILWKKVSEKEKCLHGNLCSTKGKRAWYFPESEWAGVAIVRGNGKISQEYWDKDRIMTELLNELFKGQCTDWNLGCHYISQVRNEKAVSVRLLFHLLSGLWVCVCIVHVCVSIIPQMKWKWSRSVMSHSLWPHGL